MGTIIDRDFCEYYWKFGVSWDTLGYKIFRIDYKWRLIMMKAMTATSTWWKIYKRGLSRMLNGLIAGLLLVASIPLLHGLTTTRKMNKLLYLAWPLGVVAGLIVTAAVVAAYAAWTVIAAVTVPFALLTDAALAISKSLMKLFRRPPQFLPISVSEEPSAAPADRSSYDTAAVVKGLDQSKPATGISSVPAPVKEADATANVESVPTSPAVLVPAPVSTAAPAATAAPAPVVNDAAIEEKTEHKAGFGS
jgi:hypothetical protein